MRLYFAGGEIGSHRKILQEQGVTNVAMSYMGLRRRTKFTKPWVVSERFDDSVNVFLDSGGYTLNLDTELDPEELLEIYEHYKSFVMDNIDRLDMVSEFDALPLGREWIEAERRDFWATIPANKFLAVWHAEWGIQYLQEMAEEYSIIGIPNTSIGERNLRPTLNALAAKGTRLHGIAMTAMEDVQTIAWDSVASTSWISPQRYGETIVWTGKELKRYPKKMKDTARKRHRTLFTREGFDAEAIERDDTDELLRLSIWSWKQFEGYVNDHKGSGRGVVTPLFSNADTSFAQNDETTVDTQVSAPDNEVTTPPVSKSVVRPREATQMLPVMSLMQPETIEGDEEGDKHPQITIRSESSRVCNTCFLAQKCPGYEEDSNCVYNIPISVRTREQFKALNYGMVEMQAQRVMFMRMAEEIEGGYADPNLSKEIGLLNKMMDKTNEMEKEGFSINISGSRSSQAPAAGVISRMFGTPVADQIMEIEGGPVDADSLIVDAEIVGEEE